MDRYKRCVWLALGVSWVGARAQTPASPASPFQPATQQQVTVTANRSETVEGETAKTTYVLTAEELHDFPAVTLDESLRQHAGFELFRRAPSRVANPTSEGISLRGLGSTAVSRTLVLEDGAPLNDPFGGWVHWSEAPQQTVEAVTLVSGGGSDLYGSSALGGVIDVTPSTAAPSRFDFAGMGGAQSTYDVTGTAARIGRRFGALLAGESLRTSGYVPADPAIAGAIDVPANVLSQTFRTEIGRRDFESKRVFLTGNLLNEARSNGTPLTTNGTRLWRYLAGFDPRGTDRFSSRFRAFGSNEGYRQSFSAIAAGRASETLSRLQRVRTQELGATADGTVRVGSIAFVTGADVRDIRGSDDETPIVKSVASGRVDVTARQRFMGLFGEVLGAHGPWSGAASLRADRASNLSVVQTNGSSVTAPADRTEVVVSPRVGVVRTLGSSAEVHASGFRAFRSPSMNELYRTGQVGSEITQANAGLLSERATGWEVGAKVNSAAKMPASLQATYFWTEINRPVSAVLVSQTATTITNQRQNLGQIRSDGVEISGDARLTPSISATVGYQFAMATVTKFSAEPALVGNAIPAVPQQSFTAQLRAVERHLGEVTLGTRVSGKAFDDAANQFPLAGFYTLDLSARRRIESHLELIFLAQNLTDERPQVARTPTLTLGSPIFVEAGLRLHLWGVRP